MWQVALGVAVLIFLVGRRASQLQDLNFNFCVNEVVIKEGGLSMDSRDPGNWTGGKVGAGQLKGTKYGISAASYPELDIANLSESAAIAIYERDYWNKIPHTYPELNLIAFDCAVNQGKGAANSIYNSINGATPEERLDQFYKARLARYQGLSNFILYGTGWTNRLDSIYDTTYESILVSNPGGTNA